MKYKIGAILLSSVLMGCGGGDDGNSNSASTAQPTPSTTSGINGLYTDSDSFTLMLVDSTRDSNNLIVGDFANNSVYIAHSGTTNGNTYTTSGLTYADNSSFLYGSSLPLTTTFNENTAVVTGTVNDQNLIYTFDKTTDSLPLNDIRGTHTDDSGNVWMITSNRLVITGSCIISATVTRNGAYFNLTKVTALNCANSSYNGNYDDGILATVKYNNHDYLTGVMGRLTQMLWGTVAIN